MDIFICTSSEYFYTFRAEYFYKNNSIAALRKLLPPITEELLRSVITQLPPSNTKPFYLSDNLFFTFNNGLPTPVDASMNSARYYTKGLGQLGGSITAESLYFIYTPALPLLFNSAAIYLPMIFV